MSERMNPKVVEVEYGKREIKTLTLYPLSLKDQFQVTDIICEVIQGMGNLSGEDGLNEVGLFSSFLENIGKNAPKVIRIVADITEEEADAVFDKITNDQFVLFAEKVWEVNFENALKNAKSLFERIKSQTSKQTTSKRSSQESLSVIPNTPSATSLENLSEKVELP